MKNASLQRPADVSPGVVSSLRESIESVTYSAQSEATDTYPSLPAPPLAVSNHQTREGPSYLSLGKECQLPRPPRGRDSPVPAHAGPRGTDGRNTKKLTCWACTEERTLILCVSEQEQQRWTEYWMSELLCKIGFTYFYGFHPLSCTAPCFTHDNQYLPYGSVSHCSSAYIL